MGLIKSANAPTTLMPFSMKDIENQARAILLRAQQQAIGIPNIQKVVADYYGLDRDEIAVDPAWLQHRQG